MTTYTITISESNIDVQPKLEQLEIRAACNDGQWTAIDGYSSERYDTITDAVAAIRRMLDYYIGSDDAIIEDWLIENPLMAVMTAGEAVIAFGLAEATVRQTINRGRIYARKSGETWMILRKDAEARWGNKAK